MSRRPRPNTGAVTCASRSDLKKAPRRFRAGLDVCCWKSARGGDTVFARGLAKQLTGEVVLVSTTDHWEKVNDRSVLINPHDADHYQKVFSDLKQAGLRPDHVVYLGGLTPETAGVERESGDEVLHSTFYPALYMARALADCMAADPIRFSLIANHLWEIESADRVRPAQALLLGPLLVLEQEYPNIRCSCIDIQDN